MQDSFPAADAASEQLGREALIDLTESYLRALAARDPAAAPLAPDVRFTENTAEIAVGDGLWVGASEPPTSFKIFAVDPLTQQVGFYGVMKEWDRPIILALRLKARNGRIGEMEHVIARMLRPDGLKNLVEPRPGLVADLPAHERTPRAEMFRAANAYFEAIEAGRGDLAPFDDSCTRHENGGQATTNATPQPWPIDMGNAEANRAMSILGTLTCKAQIDSQLLNFITSLRPRRLDVIDEQKGLVFGLPMFNHRGAVREIKIVGVPEVEKVTMRGGTSTLQAAEIFKIRAGRLFEIEAMGHALPYGAKTGWE